MFKKLARRAIIFVIIHAALNVGIAGTLGATIVLPAFKDSGVSFTDLLDGQLEEDQYNALNEAVEKKAAEMGKKSGRKVVNSLASLFPAPDFNYSDDAIEYPYQSIDEVLATANEKSRQGLQQGLSGN